MLITVITLGFCLSRSTSDTHVSCTRGGGGGVGMQVGWWWGSANEAKLLPREKNLFRSTLDPKKSN